MDKIDTWIENRFGTKNTFNRQLLDNFIEFLEKELGFAWKTDNQKEFIRGVAWATKEEERKREELGYVRKDDDQSLPACEYGRVEAYDNASKVRGQAIQALTQAKMLDEHWVKVREEV